jgi:hypothetical protein
MKIISLISGYHRSSLTSNPGKQHLSIPQQTSLPRTPIRGKDTGSSMCNEPSILATTMVQHRGGSYLYVPSNRHEFVLDRINQPCYPKSRKN